MPSCTTARAIVIRGSPEQSRPRCALRRPGRRRISIAFVRRTLSCWGLVCAVVSWSWVPHSPAKQNLVHPEAPSLPPDPAAFPVPSSPLRPPSTPRC